jgi:hypothetical protein
MAEFIVLFEKTACGLLTRSMQGRMENTSVTLLNSEMYGISGLSVSVWKLGGWLEGWRGEVRRLVGRDMMRINRG